MIHPLFRLIVSQPHLIADHAEAYAELVGEEVGSMAQHWKQRAMLLGIAGVLAFFAVMFLGVALMLWAAVPTSSMAAPWGLVLVPLLPALGAGFCVMGAKSAAKHEGFASLKAQVAADVAMLREASRA